MGAGELNEDAATSTYWARAQMQYKNLQKGMSFITPLPQPQPSAMEDSFARFERALMRAIVAWFSLTTECMLSEEFKAMLSRYQSDEMFQVALYCKIMHQAESIVDDQHLIVLNHCAKMFKKKFHKYSAVLPDLQAVIEEVKVARNHVLSEVRQLAAGNANIIQQQQHEAAQGREVQFCVY